MFFITTSTRFYFFLILSISVVVGCGTGASSSTTGNDSASENNKLCSESAEYRLTFNALWSSETHPTDFPGNAHFSRLVGATHTSDYILWREGEFATQGVEDMAELGSTFELENEIEVQISMGEAGDVILDLMALFSLPNTTSVTFSATPLFSLVSVVTMIAPSPDWFVGVDSIELCDDGEWLDTETIELFPYDAGTDDGTTYIAANQNTSPQEAINEITGDPFLNNGELLPLGTFVLERLN